MNRTTWIVLAVVLLAAWLVGWSSLAAFLLYRNMTAPVVVSTSNVEDFKVRFGTLEKDDDGNYAIAEETTTIPMTKYEDSTYGFQVIPPDDNPYTVQFIYHFPYPPKTITGDIFESSVPSKDMTSVKIAMHGKYVQEMGFDPGDPVGDQSIDVMINGKLAKTIKFTVTPPAADQK